MAQIHFLRGCLVAIGGCVGGFVTAGQMDSQKVPDQTKKVQPVNPQTKKDNGEAKPSRKSRSQMEPSHVKESEPLSSTKVLRKLITMYERLSDRSAQSLNQIGNIYYCLYQQEVQPQKKIEALQRAGELFEKASQDGQSLEATYNLALVYNKIADISLQMNMSDRAEEAFQRSAQYYRAVISAFDSSKENLDLTLKAINNLALLVFERHIIATLEELDHWLSIVDQSESVKTEKRLALLETVSAILKEQTFGSPRNTIRTQGSSQGQ